MSLEARINAGTWKKLVDAMKELVQDINFQCTPAGISIQAMDPAHVALVNLMLRGGGFDVYHTERHSVLGVNLASMAKILKTLDTADKLTLRHDEEDPTLTLITQTEGKTAEYQMKLLEIDADSMGVPELEYTAVVHMSGAEFSKICRDMAIFGDTVTVMVTADGVKFSGASEIGAGSVTYRATGAAPNPRDLQTQTQVASQQIAKSGAKTAAVKKEGAVKAEPGVEGAVKAEPGVEDAAAVAGARPKQEVKDEEDARPFAERYAALRDEKEGAKDNGVLIWAEEAVSLSFALRYFTIFSKGAVLAERVALHLALDQPCMVEYRIEDMGFLRFFLAPKVDGGDAA